MTKLLNMVNEMHEKLDEELGDVLERIDECLEHGRECPCEVGSCNVDYEKIEDLNALYETLLKKYTDEKSS